MVAAALQPQILTIGLNAMVNNVGANFAIAKVGISATNFTPNKDMTALPGELLRVPIMGGVDKGKSLHINAQILGALATPIRAVAFYDENDVPFAIYGAPTGTLTIKEAGERVVLGYDIDFSAVTNGNVTIVQGATDLNLIYDNEIIELVTNHTKAATRHLKLQLALFDKGVITQGYPT